MKLFGLRSLYLFTMALSLCLCACKTKKAIPAKPPEEAAAPVVAEPPAQKTLPVERKPAPTDVVAEKKSDPTSVVEKSNYNFASIKFEFDSAVLKTASYPMLDKIALEMKKHPAAAFKLNGYSSAEGTPAHNQSLSDQRASAVKSYLINAGIDESRLNTKGYGDSNPVAPNSTEENKAQNRRVEIKKN